MIWSKFAPLIKVCLLWKRKQIYLVAIYTKRKKCHIAFQFTKSYVLQANEKELFKTYPKLTKKYPVFSTRIYRRQFKNQPSPSTAIFYRRQ